MDNYGKMCFASPWISNHNHILSARDELAAGQFIQKHRRNSIIQLTAVKFFHSLEIRETCCLKPSPVLVLLTGLKSVHRFHFCLLSV